MKREKEKWIDDVFNSLEGSKRAVPSPHLFSKIEKSLFESEAKIIPLGNYRLAVAAAILLLTTNILAIYQYTQSSSISSPELINENTESLISDYKLYDL